MKSITVDDVMELDPCYARSDVERLAAGRDSLTLLEVCDLDIPPQDILWLLLREEFLPATLLHEFACDCAERALTRQHDAGLQPDPRSWAAIATKRRWLRGEATHKELAAAMDAAMDAASASCDAACSASAAASAARDASAASAAAMDAASASCDAACSARAAASAAASAARDASAARAAASAAARASCDAACSARAAATVAERKWQLDRLRAVIAAMEK